MGHCGGRCHEGSLDRNRLRRATLVPGFRLSWAAQEEYRGRTGTTTHAIAEGFERDVGSALRPPGQGLTSRSIVPGDVRSSMIVQHALVGRALSARMPGSVLGGDRSGMT